MGQILENYRHSSIKIGKKHDSIPRLISTKSLFWLGLPVAALVGLTWSSPLHWLGPAISILLIPLVLLQDTRSKKYLVAASYYLAGSHGIPLASAVFFGSAGHDALIEGIALWLASSSLLAAGWSLVNKPWQAVAVLLFDAVVPPLSLFDWMSPLASAGVWFPGLGIAGLLLTLAGIAAFRYKDVLIILGMAALLCNVIYRDPGVPAGWGGMDLHLGPQKTSLLYNAGRMVTWVHEAQTSQRRILLLPETLLTWWIGSAHYVEGHIPKGHTWLVGATIPLNHGYFADGIEAVTNKGSRMVFASALPVPVSMWMPWRKPKENGRYFLLHISKGFEPQQYRAFWFTKEKIINGKKTWANICYDQLLPFVWIEGMLQSPKIILLSNNEWFAAGTGIPMIQRASSWSWGRLIGGAMIEAENF